MFKSLTLSLLFDFYLKWSTMKNKRISWNFFTFSGADRLCSWTTHSIPSSKNIVTGMLVVYFEEHFAQLSFLSVHQFLVRDCWIISCLLSLSTLDRQCFSSSPGFTFHKDSFKNTITFKFKYYLNTELNFVRYSDQHLNTGHVNTGHLILDIFFLDKENLVIQIFYYSDVCCSDPHCTVA